MHLIRFVSADRYIKVFNNILITIINIKKGYNFYIKLLIVCSFFIGMILDIVAKLHPLKFLTSDSMEWFGAWCMALFLTTYLFDFKKLSFN